jgi:hypothetical protein
VLRVKTFPRLIIGGVPWWPSTMILKLRISGTSIWVMSIYWNYRIKDGRKPRQAGVGRRTQKGRYQVEQMWLSKRLFWTIIWK